MAKDKKENLTGMGKEELAKKLEVLRETARTIRFKAEGAKSKNVKEAAHTKKSIARILTVLNATK